jgi:uncharacterized membrane protein YqjE
MASLFARLRPAVVRHLQAYADVAGEDAREAAMIVARRLLALLIAAACALVALLMFCAWLLALAWDGPWRNWTAAGLALGFALAAAALAIPVLRRGGRRIEFFRRVRTGLHRDRELLERAYDGRRRPANGGDHAAG